jgi:signal transduction histidine kinase
VRAVSAEITRELDVTTLLNLISRRVVELVQASGAEIFLWCDTDQVLVRRAAQGEARQWEDARRRLGEGAVGTVALRREGILENEYARAPYAVPELVGRAGIRGVLAEPLLYRGRLLGVLVATDDDPAHRFSAEDQYSLRVFASQAAIALENARLFADLNEAYGRLQLVQEELLRSEKLRGLGQVAGGVVYQLNNMLSVVIGQVEDVGAHVTDPRLQEGLALVATAAADGVEMVRRLQGFSERRPEGRLVPCDLAEVVREALSLTRPRWKDEAERDGRTIRVETDLAGLPGILGDAGEIREALATLILHAVDMMPTGGALQFSARHEFAAREDFREGWVVLTVRDTGIGMPERMRARIFDPLFAAKVPGGRMGLAVVDRMIRRHGGEVGVTSLRGEGTTFTLRFRATTEQVGAKPVVEVPLEATRRILFVDDNPGVLLTTTRMLEDAGQIVVGATGGKMALERLMEGEVDLVLTDLGMPEMNGWEVAEAVKARYPQVPVVILTGWGEQAVVQETRRQVFVDRVLFKPVQRNVLLSTIAMLTGKVGS